MLARHRLRPSFVGVREEIPNFLFGGMGWEVLVGVHLVGFLWFSYPNKPGRAQPRPNHDP